MSGQSYKHGGMRQKFILFKNGGKCSRCNGSGWTHQAGYFGPWNRRRCRQCKGSGRKLVRPNPEAQYFVLRLDKDPHARTAALSYADSVESINPDLANDLRLESMRLEARAHEANRKMKGGA